MRHQKRIAKLGRSASHRKALMANLCKSLIINGKLKSTHAKIKALRPHIEKLISLAKEDSVHKRRQAFDVLRDKQIIKTLFEHIAPQYKQRQGGYTRIVKLGFRDNDCAQVSLIELVDYKMPEESKKKKKETKESKETKQDKK